jgi:hypothetical protein
VKGSAVMLAKRLSMDSVGTCASGHGDGPLGVSIDFVHWWSGSYDCSGGGWGDGRLWYHAWGASGCGSRLACGGSGARGGGVGERMVTRGIKCGCEVGVQGGGGGRFKVASCEGSLSKLGGNAAAQANANCARARHYDSVLHSYL